MKLLFVVSSFGVGGAEKHTFDLAEKLSSRGHSCKVVSLRSPVFAALDEGAIPNVSLGYCNAKRFLDFGAVSTLANHIAANAPDVVVCVNQHAVMYAHLAALRGIECRVAAIFHTTKLLTKKDYFLNRLFRFFFSRSNLLVFVCEFQARYWKERRLSARRVEIVHNGVDTERFAPDTSAARQQVRQEYGIAESDFVIGITAAFRPEKNHSFLLRALQQLRAAGVAAKLLLVGDGPLRGVIEAEADSLGVREHVVFAGAQADVRPFIAAFDVFALVSFTEAFSLAALEAMAMGIPAVLSDVGGAREMVVDGETGFVFQTNDMKQFIAAMNTLREKDTARAMGAAAHRFVNARFTHKAMVDRYEQLFGELVPKGTRGRC